MNLSFKTFDLSSKERQKAKKVQGKKYEIFLNENCRRKNKISIWKNKTSIKVEILFFYKA
ncbi:hypothetical protein APO44_08700 [Campylobacter coli]|nr:hypothetical protein [Campylobacter coli]